MQTVEQIKEESVNIPRISGDRKAVIVKTQISKRKSVLGVQFWTDAMIKSCVSKNTDMSESSFVCML